MFLKILAIATIVSAGIATGCGLAIHFKWVGKVEPTPHIVPGGLVFLLALATAVTALLTP